MDQDRPAITSSVTRRRMLHTLALSSAGVALAGRLPVNALQAPPAT